MTKYNLHQFLHNHNIKSPFLICLLQALSMFSAALQAGQLGPVVQQFGVNTDVVNAALQELE
jgi:hypothetical protein